jgi:aspartyl-tRNA(Asn)/glutamyl-tRNA(Gln) amidotransferase subunit A
MKTHAARERRLTTIASAAAGLRDGTHTSADLVEASLRAIDAFDRDTHAFIRVDVAGARAAAARADADIRRGRDLGPLHGIPISIKDLIDIAGEPTTAASRVLEDNIATADAPVITRLRAAGAVILGKTNLHEFALGTTSEDSAYGAVRHPDDLTRSPGGSSGGSAVAVATGMGLATIGSDTGGSIRIPSACCGIVGLKPSFADVPREGVVPLSTSLDHVGPLSLSVEDAATIWAVLANRPQPALSGPAPRGLRLHHVGGYFDLMSDEVRAAVAAAVRALSQGGVAVESGEITDTDIITKTYVDIVLPEAAAWHARYLDTRGDRYTPPVRARLESGRAIPAVDYLAAKDAQNRLRKAVNAALDGVDALMLPTLPITAPPIGAAEVALGPGSAKMVTVRAAMLRNTQLFNLSGHPAISLPLPGAPLPVGLQLVGRLDDTAGLLATAAACERILNQGVPGAR